MRYEIYEGNIERVRKSLNRIVNKAKKFGCNVSYEEVGETFREFEDEYGNKWLARFIVVEATGEAVINGWALIAEVEHTEEGNIIRSFGDTGVEVPERYYDSKPFCEHCGTDRYRKNTYIVMNESTGEFKQVGKSCLKDFTNGWSAEAVAQYYSFFEKLIEGEAPGSGGCHEVYFESELYLRFVAETIIKFGYEKRDWYNHVPGTADRALEFLNYKQGRLRWFTKDMIEKIERELELSGFDENDPKAVKLADDAKTWLKAQDCSSNYMHNLKVACALDYCSVGRIGILASLFPTYNRELEYQARVAAEREKAEREGKLSDWVGNVGDRIRFKAVEWKCLTSWETQYGDTFIYKFVDADSNVYTWKTSKWLNSDVEAYDIVATVKEHKVYRDVKQTEVTRCKVTKCQVEKTEERHSAGTWDDQGWWDLISIIHVN